jgi:hypothetical protein
MSVTFRDTLVYVSIQVCKMWEPIEGIITYSCFLKAWR